MHSSFSALSLRILVVDDDRDEAGSLAASLQQVGSHVRLAHDCGAAASLAAEFKPHALLAAVRGPGLEGHELARSIRRQPWGGAVLLVALGGATRREDHDRIREAGFDEQLPAPVEAMTVLAVLVRLSFSRSAFRWAPEE